MTDEQAEKIIKLLEAIDMKLSDIIDGDACMRTEVIGSVTVETDCDRPLATYEHRS